MGEWRIDLAAKASAVAADCSAWMTWNKLEKHSRCSQINGIKSERAYGWEDEDELCGGYGSILMA